MKHRNIELPPYLNASYEGDDLYTGEQMREFADKVRQEVCKELAQKIHQMPFGDTSHSFAIWVLEQS